MNPEQQNQAVSRKVREKLARQKEILDAARELFLRKGFHETTLEEIARHADYGKGTIYNYFESKEDLFRSIIDQLTNELEQMVREAVAGPEGIRAKLKAYATAVIRYANQNYDLFRFIAQVVFGSGIPEYEAMLMRFRAGITEINRMISQYLEQEIAAGKARPFDPLVLIELFDGMVRSYCMMHCAEKRVLSETEIEKVVDAIVSVFFDGIAVTNTRG